MKRLFPAALSALAGAVVLALTAPAGAAPAHGWTTPDCTSVSGDGAFSYTTDDGASITSTATRLAPQAYSHVAVLDRRDALVGVSKTTIQISRDAGCSWATIAKPMNLSQYDVAAAGTDVAYVYGINQQPIFRVAGDRVQQRSGPFENDGFVGLAADHERSNHVVAVSKDGQLYRSDDGAKTWDPVGKPVGYAYDAVFDPKDLDHIVIGTGSHGTYTTFDGGLRWTQSRGIGTRAHVNVFSVAISPKNGKTVWAEGYDLDQSGTGNGVRHIWRSVDGGRHYWPVLDGSEVTLFNGNDLYPSPTDANVLYFVYGTWYGGYGTDLYRYDDQRQSVTSQHNSYDGIDSLVFSPADPSVMYLGLEEVQVDAR